MSSVAVREAATDGKAATAATTTSSSSGPSSSSFVHRPVPTYSSPSSTSFPPSAPPPASKATSSSVPSAAATANKPASAAAASSSNASSSAFHPVASATASGQPPPTAAEAAAGIPGAKLKSTADARSHSRSSTASDSAASPVMMGDEEDGRGADGREVDGGEKAFDWPAHSTYDERRQLLGTEEESSERPSSDEEQNNDQDKNPWTITREQLNYYTTQFFSMQPNPRGAIPGTLAKEFFEKSRLPISELRKIWQLSDVTKDGSLSMEEFLTAMHLVVLRRNDIALPEELPQSLRPQTLRGKVATVAAAESRHNKDLYTRGTDRGADRGEKPPDGGGEPLLLHHDDSVDGGGNVSEDMPGYVGAKAVSATTKDAQGSSSKESGGGTEGAAALSPGSIASPGPKPVNFDFHDARRNPNIVQPVPVRLSPESPVIPTSDDEDGGAGRNGVGAAPVNVKQGRREVVYEQLWNQEDAMSAEESLSSLTLRGDESAATTVSRTSNTRTLQRSNNSTDEEDVEGEDDGCSTEIDGLQDLSPSPPSLPRDPARTDGTAGTGAAASLPYFSNALSRQRQLQQGHHQQQKSPPPPPPRPAATGRTGHARSSSLDLNHFTSGQQQGAPPAVPPRNLGAADHHLSTSSSLRPSDRIVEEEASPKAAAAEASSSSSSAAAPRHPRSLQVRIHQVREKNSVVARTINELHQEVSDTLEERIALEFHLEQLKSFGD